ncbi:hypothetical protein [Massilia timonae]|uniref:hypothetical protein n=1 Tax=Massilia timonae TaxID=47229 RepID=UPI0028D4EBF9|nr:hypothetical protein [Massilia timonae]
MSQKLTLARYLEGRGSVKSLTRIEAEAFGVPYPLVSGWPARYGPTEITSSMLDDLASRVEHARRSTANKARRGLEGVERVAPLIASRIEKVQRVEAVPQPAEVVRVRHGFVLRRARRYCARREHSNI